VIEAFSITKRNRLIRMNENTLATLMYKLCIKPFVCQKQIKFAWIERPMYVGGRTNPRKEKYPY
jgi:hypothetical protein